MQDNDRNPTVTPEQIERLRELENMPVDSLRTLVAEIEAKIAEAPATRSTA